MGSCQFAQRQQAPREPSGADERKENEADENAVLEDDAHEVAGTHDPSVVTAVVKDKHEPDAVHHLISAAMSMAKFKGVVDVPEWLNDLVKRLWPKLSIVLKHKITQSLSTTITEELPLWLGPKVKVLNVDLGDGEAPRIEAICCEEITDGIKVMIAFNCACGLKVDMSVAGVPFGMYDGMASGCLVAEMGPLLGDLPLVGGVSIHFVYPPQLEYKFTGAGKITELPVLRRGVRAAIDSIIASRMLLPNSIMVALVHDDATWKLGAKNLKGVIRVTAQSATSLGNGDWSFIPGRGSSDPYVHVRVGSNTWSSSTVKGSNSPKWPTSDYHDFAVYDLSQKVVVEVLDEDWMTSDDSLGVLLPLSIPDALAESQKPLQLFKHIKYNRSHIPSSTQGKVQGQLQMKYEWFNISQQPLGQDVASAPGFVLTAKIGVLKMPANLRDSAQVLLKFGPRVTRSQSLDVRSAKIDAAVDSITSATVDIVRKGAKLGVDPSVLAEMTHLEPQIIADILADDRPEANEAVARDIANRRLAASMNFGSCLAVPVSKLADLDKTKVEIHIRGASKVLAKASLRLGIGEGLVWPPRGHEGELAQLLGDGTRMELDVQLSVSALMPGAPPVP
mmetsp:Transcript_34443/g.97869  ORF Transcript_34443/g.97869 Transcript_34443/m.97869 type:complete len:618 (-) Transcript_34443:74-1927(-)